MEALPSSNRILLSEWAGLARRALPFLVAAIFLISILIWTFSEIDRPTYSRPSGGEQWSYLAFSDYITLIGGKRFAEEGFAENYFLTNMTVGYPEFARGWYAYQTALTDVPNASIYTTHTGPFDAMVVGLLFNLGVTELPDLYKIAAVFSIIALGLWYGAATLLFGRPIALVSLVFTGTSLLFLSFIATIAGYIYDILFSFGALFLFLWAERNRDVGGLRRSIAYGGAWLLTSMEALNSPEFIPFLLLFFVGYLWAVGGMKGTWKRWRTAVLMVSAPVVAQLLHFVQVAWALGGFGRAATDFWAAIARRTTGFQLAEETEFRTFQLSRTLGRYELDLWKGLHLELIGLAVLLALAWWLQNRLRKRSGSDAEQPLWNQWKVLLVLFLGGIALWVVYIQGTVTSTGSVYRPILPFVGAALGYCAVLSVKYLKLPQEHWRLKAATLFVLVALVAPMAQHRLSGEPFNPRAYFQSVGGYFGMYPEEIRMLGTFLQEKTAYGDIVITNLRVAETGHPRYPFPAYEYLSDRRIEVARDVRQATIALRELQQVRASLPSDNPASGVQFNLHTDEGSIGEDFGHFAKQVGNLKDTLYEADYWTELYGTVPFPVGSSMAFPPSIFYLFKVDAGKLNDYQLTAERVDGRSPQP